MRSQHLILAAICSIIACVRSAPPSATASAPTPPSAAAATAGAVVPLHKVSEVEPPPVLAKSEPVPGFMRGINLGDGLDAPSEGAWGVTLEPAHFTLAKSSGLDHVRLPVRFSAHAGEQAPYTVDPAFFARVDWAIDQATKNGLSIIVDLHHYEELMKLPKENTARLIGIWKQIAERYKNQPATVAFELINEPCDQLTAELLNPITQQTLAAVRASNPKRLVFVDSFFWASAEQLKNLDLPEDPNLVPSFHNYQPILFTHQGMPFMAPEFQTRPVVFPGPPATPVELTPAAQSTDWVSNWFYAYNHSPIADNSGGPSAVFDYYKTVEHYLKTSKRRLYMGEFGVADSADPQSRENWLRLVRQEAEKRNIGWAVWDDGGRFRAMNVKEGTWVPPVQAGLFH